MDSTIIRVPRDPTTSIFRSGQEYDDFMESYILGLVMESENPQPGDIALLIAENSDVVAVGVVLDESAVNRQSDESVLEIRIQRVEHTMITQLTENELSEVSRIEFIDTST